MRSLQWEQVHARRLARNHLRERAPRERLADVVRDVGGVQAQVAAASELALAARVESITRADVRAALWDRRELVKAWTLRGTLHLHAAADFPLWIAARRTSVYWREPRWLETFALTIDEAEAIVAAIGDALDGRALTRQELGDEVAARVGEWARRETPVIQFGKPGVTWHQLLGAEPVTVCQGPPRGRNVTFVRADQWVPGWHEPDPASALAEAFRRYLATYGPATPDEFAHWLYPRRRGEARRLADELAGELEPVEVDGRHSWLLASDADAEERTAGTVRLLPDYDCYLIGAAPPGRQREAVVPAATGNRVFGGGAGPFAAVVVDGTVAGAWKRRARGKRVAIRVEPFRRLTTFERRKLHEEARRIGEFLGAEPDLEIA
ncbi:MAG: AlkZ family DNA glycosylase [Thermoleophilia bacterium]|nr:AlkZ family DNA glycosylase [Thermoleophilia bacterium]